MLSIDDQWVWDFWIADDGELFHAFYLSAPRSLGDPRRRHRHARIGHATSPDLTDWTILGTVLQPGLEDSFDATATWTGSVVRADDGSWRMFYTGSRFLHPEPAIGNIQSIGVATSPDLYHWEKRPGPPLTADPTWYELYGTSTWPEQAWRDPWVFRSPTGDGWHMLITARTNQGPDDDRGVIGHAWSPDLDTWHSRPPLTASGSGYGHLEVAQVAHVGSRWLLLYSCNTSLLSRRHRASGASGGVWMVPIDDPTQPFDLTDARLLLDETRYSGRILQDRAGQWQLLAFPAEEGDGFIGKISDPVTFEDQRGTTP